MKAITIFNFHTIVWRFYGCRMRLFTVPKGTPVRGFVGCSVDVFSTCADVSNNVERLEELACSDTLQAVRKFYIRACKICLMSKVVSTLLLHFYFHSMKDLCS